MPGHIVRIDRGLTMEEKTIQERYAQQFQYIVGNFGCLWHMVHVWRYFGDHSQIFHEFANPSAFKNVSPFSVSLTPNIDHGFHFHDSGIGIWTIFCVELSYGIQQGKYYASHFSWFLISCEKREKKWNSLQEKFEKFEKSHNIIY